MGAGRCKKKSTKSKTVRKRSLYFVYRCRHYSDPRGSKSCERPTTLSTDHLAGACESSSRFKSTSKMASDAIILMDLIPLACMIVSLGCLLIDRSLGGPCAVSDGADAATIVKSNWTAFDGLKSIYVCRNVLNGHRVRYLFTVSSKKEAEGRKSIAPYMAH